MLQEATISDGVCKLTGKEGRFVKAHIIPRALAPPRAGGKVFPQFGSGYRPTKRFDSWYDPRLVTRDGEDILTGYDSWAIEELRRLKLIWQSWGPMQGLSTKDHIPLHIRDWGYRKVTFSDPQRMRLFFLSILWRAAASDLVEFREINVKPPVLRQLRRYVRDAINPPENFFPISLTQLSSRGEMHNHAPLAQIKVVSSFLGTKEQREPIFRFYFDGLIIHYHCNPIRQTMDGLGLMLVGSPTSTVISTVTSKGSWQMENLLRSITEADRQFPGILSRIEKTAGIE